MSTYVERVAVFGDSSTLALGTEDGRGCVQELHARYRRLNEGTQITRRPHIFYELGVFASKAADIAQSVIPETERRFSIPTVRKSEKYNPEKRLAIVSVGTNDSWLRTSGTHVTPMNEYSESMQQIANTLTERSRVLFLGLFPCNEKISGEFWRIPVPPQFESRLLYEKEALRIFQAAGAVTVPMVEAAYNSSEYMGDISPDGVHVGKRGESWVYRRVTPYFFDLVQRQPIRLDAPCAQ